MSLDELHRTLEVAARLIDGAAQATVREGFAREHVRTLGEALSRVLDVQRAIHAVRPDLEPAFPREPSAVLTEENRAYGELVLRGSDLSARGDVRGALDLYESYLQQNPHPFFRELAEEQVRFFRESLEVAVKRFEAADETRSILLGSFEVVFLGGMAIGRATYQPGWKWSEHVGLALGQTRCEVEHVGLVLAGRAAAAFDDGRVVELRAGELFHIPRIPHDSWVIGDESYVSLHLMGADDYAKKSEGKEP